MYELPQAVQHCHYRSLQGQGCIQRPLRKRPDSSGCLLYASLIHVQPVRIQLLPDRQRKPA